MQVQIWQVIVHFRISALIILQMSFSGNIISRFFLIFATGNYCQPDRTDPDGHIRKVENRRISAFHWDEKKVCNFSFPSSFQKIPIAAAKSQRQRKRVFFTLLSPQNIQEYTAVICQQAASEKKDAISFPAESIISNAAVLYVPEIQVISDNFFLTVQWQIFIRPFFGYKIQSENRTMSEFHSFFLNPPEKNALL